MRSLAVTSILFSALSIVAQTPANLRYGNGLKEALSIGADHAVDATGVNDGFLGNPSIKIVMPERLHLMEKSLRMAGQTQKIDEFVVSMNRAAEKAAPAARLLFKNAIASLTFSDAHKIIRGGKTSATDYFRDKTTAGLTTAFRPMVEEAMEQTGVTRQYKGLAGHFKAVPFAQSQKFDIHSYMLKMTLDGLFYMLGLQEEKIRTEPAAQVTPLLKDVFGKR